MPGMADGAGPDSLPLLLLDGADAEAATLEEASAGNAARSLRARAPVDYKEPAEVWNLGRCHAALASGCYPACKRLCSLP